MAQPDSPEAIAFGRPARGWRRRWFTIIFEASTPEGRRFNIALMTLVLISVAVVMLETVDSVAIHYGTLFTALEWLLTLVFTVEYIARLLCVQRPLRYARSFFGLVDLASVLPMYLAALLPGLHVLIDIRVLRLLRAFRILKLTAYLHEYAALGGALYASRRKIAVFLAAVAMLMVVLGTVMYVVEGPTSGFTSIPVAVYWATTTMTTGGLGDVTPNTDLGRAISSIVMLLGWGVLAVPTGIVTAEMTSRRVGEDASRVCGACGTRGHQAGARFCHRCGAALAASPLVR